MESLTEQINGKLETKNDKGAVVSIQFPKLEA
jgi:two-component sensor histidine kinase